MSIGREQRIRETAEFRSVLRNGRRSDGRFFVLYARRGVRSAARLGLSVSRRVGGAVQRNRVKRLLRAAFAQAADGCAPVDVVVVAKAEIVGHGVADIGAELRRRLERWRQPKDPTGE